jgi:hypothetical protein
MLTEEARLLIRKVEDDNDERQRKDSIRLQSPVLEFYQQAIDQLPMEMELE